MSINLSRLKLKNVPDGIARDLLRAYRILYRLDPSIREEVTESDFVYFRYWFSKTLRSSELALRNYLEFYRYDKEL